MRWEITGKRANCNEIAAFRSWHSLWTLSGRATFMADRRGIWGPFWPQREFKSLPSFLSSAICLIYFTMRGAGGLLLTRHAKTLSNDHPREDVLYFTRSRFAFFLAFSLHIFKLVCGWHYNFWFLQVLVVLQADAYPYFQTPAVRTDFSTWFSLASSRQFK